ncbi:unnamed protein product [Cunninghamella blakesleeana]
MKQIIFLYLCSILVSSVLGFPLRIRELLSPTTDPFYQPPNGYESAKDGTILKQRNLPNGLALLSAFPQNTQAVYQFLYKTTDALGNPTATVTTLIIPHNADTSKLVSYQVAEDSPYIECAPSYTFQKDSGIAGVNTQVELLLIDTLLSRGYYVSVPDYQGPGSYFTVGAMAGHGVLDSIRAVLTTTNTTNLQSNAKVQIWGYSGGALASGWAVQLQPSYAPELTIIGAALGGTPVNVNATLNAIDGTAFAGLVPSGIIGLTQQYPELNNYVNQVLLPSKKQMFEDAKKKCLGQLIIDFAFQRFSTFVNRPDYLNDPIATKVITENIMGKTDTPKIPIFMYHSKHDEIVPFNPAKNLYNDWCSKGATIEFVQDELSEHVILAVTGAANAIGFIIHRFADKAVSMSCSTRTTLSSALYPGAVQIFGKAIWDMLNAILHGPIGPNNMF